MCGILGVAITQYNRDVMKNLFDIFDDQKSRGEKGAGISINNDTLYRFRSHSPYRIFAAYNFTLWKSMGAGSRVMIHHRYPTSTDNKPKCNHPIASEDGKIHLIHNGIISNWRALEKELRAKGHTFETEDDGKITDSEVLVHLLEEGLKQGDMLRAIEYMDKEAQGSYAVAIQCAGEQDIWLLKRSNPIIISKDGFGNHYFSSEFRAMNDMEKVRELAHGEIGKLSTKGYECAKEGTKEHSYGVFDKRTWSWDTQTEYSRPVDYIKPLADNESVDLGKKCRKLIRRTINNLSTKKKGDYMKVCMAVFKEVQEAHPKWDLTYHPIRIAIREEIDKSLDIKDGSDYIG